MPLVNELQVEGSNDLDSRATRGMWLVGHLKVGISAAQAAENLNSIAASLARAYPTEDQA
jgi:hypothetical protein